MSAPRETGPEKRPARHGQRRDEVPDFLGGDHQLRDWAAGTLYPLCRYLSKGAPLRDLLEARANLDCLIEAETAKRSLR